MKAKEWEGEKMRKVELGGRRKVCGRSTGRDDEHKGKSNPSNQILSKKHLVLFVAYRFRFVGMKVGKFWREVASRRLISLTRFGIF